MLSGHHYPISKPYIKPVVTQLIKPLTKQALQLTLAICSAAQLVLS